MFPRFSQLINSLHRTSESFFNIFKQPPREFALAYVSNSLMPTQKTFSIEDIIGNGILFAVPKHRRTVEKRMQRKFGHPMYNWKPHLPKENIIVCKECGHHYQRAHLCENCYRQVEKETNEIKEVIQKKLGLNPIENDVIVLYKGDEKPEQQNEFWNGKRIIEMPKERPKLFSKNLLQKSTQQTSDSKDVKPTNMA